MSYWTHVCGIITVSPMGRTQAEKRYILETVLEHLPVVTGSEGDINVHIVQAAGHDESSNYDEFGQASNTLKDRYGNRNKYGWMDIQSTYYLVVEGDFRDRMFEETFAEFSKWLCRLAKRVDVDDVMVKLRGYGKEYLFTNKNNIYSRMFEDPSWMNEAGEPAWCEYLMWEHMKDSFYPKVLGYKYFADEDNDKAVESWIGLPSDKKKEEKNK